jgi:hypothetical protein
LTDQDDPTEAVDRLERALERIATLAASASARVRVTSPSRPEFMAEADMHELAERLDHLIAQLRAALDAPASPS